MIEEVWSSNLGFQWYVQVQLLSALEHSIRGSRQVKQVTDSGVQFLGGVQFSRKWDRKFNGRPASSNRAISRASHGP